MALSTAKGFRYRKSLISALDQPEPIQVIIANSTTLTIGEVVRVNTSGFLVANGVSGVAMGVVAGFVDSNGINPFSLVYDTTATGVTLAPGNPGTQDSVTTSSTNQTQATKMLAEVIVDPSGTTLLYNLANSTVALSQSNLLQFFNLTSDSMQVDTNTGSNTSGVMQLIQLDPDQDGNTAKGLFKLSTNQLSDFISNGTAVRAA